MCLTVQVFSFSIVNVKKMAHDFLQFSHFLTHILAVYLDAKQSTRQMCSPSCYDWTTAGESWCAQVFFKETSQLLSNVIWTPLDNFLWSRRLALSLSLSLSRSVCLSVCLSFSLSVSLSLTQTLSQSLSLSLSLSLSHLPLVLSSIIDICLHVRKNTCQNCYSRTVKHAAPSSSRSRVEVVVVVVLPYVMSFMSTRRSAKPMKKRFDSIQEELQKSFPTADDLPEKNAWPLGAWKRCTKTPFRRKRSRWTTEVSQNAIQSAEESCFLPTKAAPGAVATVQHVWLEIGL